MLVYLDTCAIQRPFDDHSQIRIAVEAEAVLSLIELVERKDLRLLSSEILLLEVEKNPYPTRREFALEVLSLASKTVQVTERIELRSRMYVESGISPSDALHLASAVEAKADVFNTTDDSLYRKGQSISTRATRVLSPLELIEEVGS